MMLEELERRNYTESTTRAYLQIVQDFACYFHRSPDQLGPEQMASKRRGENLRGAFSTAVNSGSDAASASAANESPAVLSSKVIPWAHESSVAAYSGFCARDAT
jgi:hypothetical protein